MHRISSLVATLLLFVGTAVARTPTVACSGRFAIAAKDRGLLGDGSPAATRLEVDAAGELSLDGCGTTTARVRAKKRATVVQARWTECHAAVKVVLNARIASPTCDALSGSVKRKGAKRVRFDATLVACDDGRLDPG